MPYVTVNGRKIHYTETGTGAETVVFSHGFLMNLHMYDAQIARLAERYRVVAFDHRGHGESDRAREPYGMYDLVDDAAAVIRETCDGPVHFAGMSTGGFVGVRLALRHPELIRSLMLIDTAATAEDPAKLGQYNLLLTVVRWFGPGPVTKKVMSLLMAEPFRTDSARAQEHALWAQRIKALDGKSMHRFGKAIFSRDNVLEDIRVAEGWPPTLIIVGEDDVATPLPRAEEMHAAIPGSRLIVVPGSGHSSPIEAPEIVSDALEEFLLSQG